MSAEMFGIMSEFLPTLDKYSNLSANKLHITTIKEKSGVTLKIESDNLQIGDALSDIMKVVAKLTQGSNLDFKLTDINKRGS